MGATPFEKAGLTNGSLNGFSVTGATEALQQADAKAKGAIAMDRTDDGAWDPQNPNNFYFVTTGSIAPTATHGRGGLWRMRFNDVTSPSLGAT